MTHEQMMKNYHAAKADSRTAAEVAIDGTVAKLAKGSHTPGPWTTRDHLRTIGIVQAATKEVLAQVPGCDPNDEVETIANARLIAAAPELLEACKAMFHKYDTVALCGVVPDSDVKRVMSMARAAIAKAGGAQ